MIRFTIPVAAMLLCCAGAQAPREPDVAAMLASTVQVEVQIAATLILPGDEEIEMGSGWVGSGVVYEKSPGDTGPVTSKILTAHHVLDTPKPGTLVPFRGPFGFVVAHVRVDAVLITLRTHDGRTCDVQPLKLGVTDTRDVATALASCDAGAVAPIALHVPDPGERVYVSGHPLGVPVAIVTEGFVSGWLEGYLLVSAGATGGNSGGPVFYRGQVIGLLVRGAQGYPNISLVTPLSELHARITETAE